MSDPESRQQGSTLTAIGVTVLGIVLSLAVTVAFGVPGPWWLRVGAGAATALLLVVAVKLGTRHGRSGLLSRLARWVLSEPA